MSRPVDEWCALLVAWEGGMKSFDLKREWAKKLCFSGYAVEGERSGCMESGLKCDAMGYDGEGVIEGSGVGYGGSFF